MVAESAPPAYYTIAELRRHFGRGWSTQRVRRWLKREGVLEKRGRLFVATSERLAAAFPEVYRRIAQAD